MPSTGSTPSSPRSSSENINSSPTMVEITASIVSVCFKLVVLGNFYSRGVSPFSLNFSNCGTSRNHFSSQIPQTNFPTINNGGRAQQRSLLLTSTDSSSSSSVSLPPVAEVKQEIRSLFVEYCDEDHLLNMKTIESMPPFVDLLVC